MGTDNCCHYIVDVCYLAESVPPVCSVSVCVVSVVGWYWLVAYDTNTYYKYLKLNERRDFNKYLMFSSR